MGCKKKYHKKCRVASAGMSTCIELACESLGAAALLHERRVTVRGTEADLQQLLHYALLHYAIMHFSHEQGIMSRSDSSTAAECTLAG